MARTHGDPPDSRYYYRYSPDEREPPRRSHRRRHRHRDEYDDYIEAATPRRERRERRRSDSVREEPELNIDELRTQRADYYSRPEPERRREARPMAQEIAQERDKTSSRSTHTARESTRHRRRKERIEDDRSEDDYVYARPRSSRFVEEVTVKRTPTRRTSDEGPSRPTAESPRKAPSVRRMDVPKLKRSMSTREPSKIYMSTRPSVRRSSTVKLPAAPTPPLTRAHSMSVKPTQSRPSAHHRKSTGGFLATLFRPPVRSSTAILHKEVQRVDCIVCMDDEVPANKTAKLSCGHRMCHSCLKRQFELSVTDPKHMPPTCCTHEHIPLRHVERLFDNKFKILWNKKFQEYTTANRLYCPNKGCGEWIKPTKIRIDFATGRKYARCSRCSFRVCILCNGRFHTRRECPKDDETKRLVQLAKEKGWQRCHSCKAMVELKEGCNHMTCRCTAQFCMLCAAPWKTCNCPWFNYEHIPDGDRLNDMRVPQTPMRRPDIIEVVEIEDEAPPPPLVRRSSTRMRRRDRDRSLERADEALAAALQEQLLLNPTPSTSEGRRSGPDVYAFGNTHTHHMNDSYTVRTLATPAARAAPRSTPRLFGRRVVREHTRTRPSGPVTASTMAGLAPDGSRRGAGRVGVWIQHVEVDFDAVESAPRTVEVDEWNSHGQVVGVD